MVSFANGRSIATETLAARRNALLAELAEVEAQLHAEMRTMREAGATQVEIVAASGYRSIDAVRKILDPAVRDGAASTRKRKRLNDGRASTGRVILTTDAAEALPSPGLAGAQSASARTS